MQEAVKVGQECLIYRVVMIAVAVIDARIDVMAVYSPRRRNNDI